MVDEKAFAGKFNLDILSQRITQDELQAAMTRFRNILSSLVVLLAAVFVAAQARSEEIVITLWGTGMYGAPYAVAMEKGFFKKNGVDVTGILTAAGGRHSLVMDVPGRYARAADPARKRGKPQRMIQTTCLIGTCGDSVSPAISLASSFRPACA